MSPRLRIFFAIAASGLNIENQQEHGRYEYEQNARHETQIINLHRKKASRGFQSNTNRISPIGTRNRIILPKGFSAA